MSKHEISRNKEPTYGCSKPLKPWAIIEFAFPVAPLTTDWQLSCALSTGFTHAFWSTGCGGALYILHAGAFEVWGLQATVPKQCRSILRLCCSFQDATSALLRDQSVGTECTTIAPPCAVPPGVTGTARVVLPLLGGGVVNQAMRMSDV